MMVNVTQAMPDTTHKLLVGFHQGSGQAKKKKKGTFLLPENPKVYMYVHVHTYTYTHRHTAQPLGSFPQYSPSNFCSAIQTMSAGGSGGGGRVGVAVLEAKSISLTTTLAAAISRQCPRNHAREFQRE